MSYPCTPIATRSAQSRKRSGLPCRATIGLAVALAWLGAAAAPASAQLSRLSNSDFIEGLEEWGLNELIIDFIEKHPPDNPIEKQLVIIKQHVLRFDDPSLDEDERAEAFASARQGYEALLAERPDGGDKDEWETQWYRWGTNYGQLLLRNLDREKQAAWFYDFGVPTLEQRELFLDLGAQAAIVLNAAYDEHWYTMSTLITRREDFDRNFVNTGRWDRMERQGKVELPLFRARATLYAALQGDDGPYFQHLAAEAKKREAPFDPATAREDILRANIRNLEELAAESLAAQYAIGAKIKILSARSKLALGQYAQAMADLDPTISAAEDPMDRLLARFTRVLVLEQSGLPDEAIDELRVIDREEALNENPLLMILLADREHLMIQAAAPEAAESQIRASYEPYSRLLADPRLAALGQGMIDVVKDHIYTRLEQQIPADADLAELPDMVLLAIGTKSMQSARAIAEQDPEAARERFGRAVDVLNRLLRRQNLTDAVGGEALYTLGVTHYLAGETVQPGATVHAAETFVRLADVYPDQPLGATSIAYALQLSRALYQNNPRNESTASQYRRALEVLFKRFGSTDLAATERYTYAALLREWKEYEAAVTAYDEIASDHPYRAEAYYERLVCLRELWFNAEPSRRDPWVRPLLDSVEAFLEYAPGAIALADDDRKTRLKRYEGDALIMKGDVLIESHGAFDEAIAALEDFDRTYRQYPALVSQAIRLRIRIYQRQGEYAAAKKQIEALLERFPDQAGPVMDSVIDSLFEEIEALRQDDRAQEADQMVDLAVDLTSELLTWAKGRPEWQDRMLVFELMAGRAELYDGQYTQAVERFERLYEQASRNADVIEGFAEARFGAKQYEGETGAGRLFNRLIKELPDKQSPRSWNAWAKSLTIADELLAGEKDPTIATRVRRLEAEFDPQLGGDPYRDVLVRLRNKHGR